MIEFLADSADGYTVLAVYFPTAVVGNWILGLLAWYLTANLVTYLLIVAIGTWAAVNAPYHRRRGPSWGFLETEPSWSEAASFLTVMLVSTLPILIWNMTPMVFRKVKSLCK